MKRYLLYLSGISAAATAWIAYRSGRSPARIVPVQEAAAKLQQAWADHHTQA